MRKQKILHLTLKRKWFDLIASGEKKEEYRELKTYWIKRLSKYGFLVPANVKERDTFIQFDIIQFRIGYSKTAPMMQVECKGIDIGEGNPDWGAKPNEEYFIIKLGKILRIANHERSKSNYRGSLQKAQG